MEQEIIPRLEQEVPHQPSAEPLAADPTLDKFILVYDREGYSRGSSGGRSGACCNPSMPVRRT